MYTYLKSFEEGQDRGIPTPLQRPFASTAATSAVPSGNLLGKTFFGSLFAQYSLTVAVNGYNQKYFLTPINNLTEDNLGFFVSI